MGARRKGVFIVRRNDPVTILGKGLIALFFSINFLSTPAAAQSAPTISQLVANQNRGTAPALTNERSVMKQQVRPTGEFRLARQVRVDIDWAAARTAARNFSAAKRNFSQPLDKLAVSQINMPILMPEKLPSGTLLMGKDYYYHGVTRHNGYGVSIHGTCILSEVRTPGDKKAGVQDMHIFQTEDGMAASFSLFGAAYSVMMVCDDPKNDKRCSSQAYMKQIVDGMIVSLGGGA